MYLHREKNLGDHSAMIVECVIKMAFRQQLLEDGMKLVKLHCYKYLCLRESVDVDIRFQCGSEVIGPMLKKE